MSRGEYWTGMITDERLVQLEARATAAEVELAGLGNAPDTEKAVAALRILVGEYRRLLRVALPLLREEDELNTGLLNVILPASTYTVGERAAYEVGYRHATHAAVSRLIDGAPPGNNLGRSVS